MNIAVDVTRSVGGVGVSLAQPLIANRNVAIVEKLGIRDRRAKKQRWLAPNSNQ